MGTAQNQQSGNNPDLKTWDKYSDSRKTLSHYMPKDGKRFPKTGLTIRNYYLTQTKR